MTLTGAAERSAAPVLRDLLGAAPIVALRAAGAALAVAAVGQVAPSLVNVAGGGLAVTTQLRVGWLYTMAGHAASITASGSMGTGPEVAAAVLDLRLGLLTIAALAVAMLFAGARAAARRVDDVGIRRPVAGATIAVPYAVLIGGVNAVVALQLRFSGELLPESTTIASPVWEGFVLPGTIALVAGSLGGWSASASWQRAGARAVRAGIRAFLWAVGLSFIALLVFAALRPEGLERYSTEMWSGGPQRAGLYAGHQALLLPDQAMWVLAPAMGGCVSLRTGSAAHDLLCLDRIPRGPDPATWLLSELGRIEGTPPTSPAPAVVWLFVAVPVGALVLGFRSLGRTARSWPRSIARGLLGGVVFACLVVATSLAGSLWLTLREGDVARRVALGPDPVTTAVLALVWGLVGGAIVCVGGWLFRRLSRRAAPR